MPRTHNQWLEKYTKRGALWVHDGNPKRPHVRLSKGGHSDGFFDSELVMEDPALLEEACFDLVVKASSRQGLKLNASSVDRVVGPAMGAITMAHQIPLCINAARHMLADRCLRAYTEKLETATGIRMVFKRTWIKPGEYVLQCEDVVTTGSSVELTTKAVVEAGGIVLPFVLVLVNRSGLEEVGKQKIVALIDMPMNNWAPNECPLCQAGSEVLHPAKQVENWTRLNAEY